MKIISRKDAVLRGRLTYFTGKPCKKGHLSARRVLGGVCLACLVERRRERKAKIKKQQADERKALKRLAIKKLDEGIQITIGAGAADPSAARPRRLPPPTQSRAEGESKKNVWRTRDKYYFNRKKANRIVDFFEKELVHIKGKFAGKPLRLEPWQRRILRRAFGWIRRDDGTRKYREIYIEVPRKNGKSTLVAGIGLYLLLCDREVGAEIVSAAGDREQAGNIFDVAKHNVDLNPRLNDRARAFAKTITYYKKASKFKVISSEAKTKHGSNLHGVLFDELHTQENRDLFDTLRSSTSSRLQPLQVYITTAGFDRNSICWEQHDYAVKVRDGIIEDESFLSVIYALDEKDEELYGKDYWKNEKLWFKANPNLGISKSLEYMRKECQRAIDTPGYENTFKRLELNIWTEQDTRWLSMTQWDKNSAKFEIEQLKGRECFAGIDLSSTMDISALVLLFPLDDGTFAVLPFFWVPEKAAPKRKTKARVPYPEWVSEGLIMATDGDVVDYDKIRQKVIDLSKIYNIREIAIDRWNATQIMTQLQGDGFTVVPFGQGYKDMSSPCRELEKLIVQARIKHGGHKVLRWMASNVSVEQDHAGSLKLSKKRSKEKIDGMVCLVMGLGRYLVAEPPQLSVYEKRAREGKSVLASTQ